MESTQQLLVLDKVFQLLHEFVKLALLVKIINELAKAEDDMVRQNLSLALGSLLQLSPHMNQFGYNPQNY